MSRDITAALAAEFAAKRLAPLLFVEIQFVSGWVRLWSGRGSIDWNESTWLGVQLPDGTLLGTISQLPETTELEAQAVALSLSGIPAGAVQQAINECRQNFTASIYLGARNLETGDIVVSPYRAWSGYTDVPTIADGGDTCTITISVESRLVDLQRQREWRYTHEDQQISSPGDLGFQFVGGLQNFDVKWGSGKPIGPPGGLPVRV